MSKHGVISGPYFPVFIRTEYGDLRSKSPHSKHGVTSGPYFPVFGLNTEIYEVNLHIQSEYRKIRTRNNSTFGHVSRSVR